MGPPEWEDMTTLDAITATANRLDAVASNLNRAIGDGSVALECISRADDAAIETDMAHTAASETALAAAAVLSAATAAVVDAVDPDTAWMQTRRECRERARWSAGDYSFDDAERDADLARFDADLAFRGALFAERTARLSFDTAAERLAEAAAANRAADAVACGASDQGVRALSAIRRNRDALLKWCAAAEAVVDAAEAVSTITGASEELAADATYHRLNTVSDADAMIDRLMHVVE